MLLFYLSTIFFSSHLSRISLLTLIIQLLIDFDILVIQLSHIFDLFFLFPCLKSIDLLIMSFIFFLSTETCECGYSSQLQSNLDFFFFPFLFLFSSTDPHIFLCDPFMINVIFSINRSLTYIFFSFLLSSSCCYDLYRIFSRHSL